MSLLRTLPRTSAVSCPHPTRAFLAPPLCNGPPRRDSTQGAVDPRPRSRKFHGTVMDNFFIHALVRASSCPKHAKQISTLRDVIPFSTPHHKTRRKSPPAHAERRQYKSTKTPLDSVKDSAKNELKALVDYYDLDLDSQRPEGEEGSKSSLAWDGVRDHKPWPPKEPKDNEMIAKLRELLKNEEPPHDEIFDTYMLLPEPRVVYLSTSTIRDMLHHLAIVERPTVVAMQRYLSVLDDMKNAHIHIQRSEWTSAIHLAGRCMGPVSADDLTTALSLWRDMEKKAGVKGSWVTFNVLFDISVKAGKFTLAELFLKEMQARRLPFHRHFRISLLYYHGVMQNGSGIRRVYREMVELGDIVDVVVMNAVIAALIRAGEPSAAEHVFERMKRLALTGTASFYSGHFPFDKNSRNWRVQRKLGLHLTYQGRQLVENKDTKGLKELQDWAPIAPNSHTYSILIRHQATTAGNIDRVNDLLREMGYNGVPLEGSIFVAIFRGFINFGGVRYSSWTRTKLEQTWTEYLQAVNKGLPRTFLSQTGVVAALKAFKKCTDAERTLRAWDEVRDIWRPSMVEAEGVMKTLKNLVPQGGFFNGAL